MAVDALREHEDALSGSAKTMEDTKKLLEETAAGASRLLEMNRRLREELDAARAERDAARAEAQETRARAHAPVVGSGSPREEVAALRAALAEAERNLQTVSAGFRLLQREREEALDVLKGSEATRAALDQERAAVARMREAMTPTTSSKTSVENVENAGFSTASAARLSRGQPAGRRHAVTPSRSKPSRPLRLPFIGEEEDGFGEPASACAGLSAATGAPVSDDEETHAGSAFGESDASEAAANEPFSFARPQLVSGLDERDHGDVDERIVSMRASARRPDSAPPSERLRADSAAGRVEPAADGAAARRLRALGDADGARRPVTARSRITRITGGLGRTRPGEGARSSRASTRPTADDRFTFSSETSETETNGDATDARDSGSERDSGSDRFDLRADLRDARLERARLERTRRDRMRLDRIRSRASRGKKQGGSAARGVRLEPGEAFPEGKARLPRQTLGSRVSSRASSRVPSRATTPAVSPVKLQLSRRGRDGRGHGAEEDKPAFRPAGVAMRAAPAELLTGATLGAAARRLAAADARFARWAEGAPGQREIAVAAGVSARRRHGRGGGNARRRAQ